MRKFTTYLMITIASLVVLAGAGYLSLARFYEGRIGLNVWINDVYCTGKTPDEVRDLLTEQFKDPAIEIIDREGQSYALPFEFFDYSVDFESSLTKYLVNTRKKSLFDSIGRPQHLVIRPEIFYEEEKLKACFEDIPFVKEELARPEKYDIVMGENGYEFVDGLSDRLDTEKCFALLKEYVSRAENKLDYSAYDCYRDVEASKEDLNTLSVWEKVNEFISTDIVFDMGEEKIALRGKILSSFLQCRDAIPEIDFDGQVILDETAVAKFVDDLCEDYDTYQKERDFTTALGDTVKVKGVKYGTKLNRDAILRDLKEMLENVRTGDHSPVEYIPVYEKEANVRGRNDIGGTYIEIDLTNQKMYYFEDFIQVLETDVVTGDMFRKRETPAGVNYIYNKSRNRTLRGPGYAAFVKYWMAVKDGIGIHDASWRKEFGGEEYLKNGSHGCINTPLEIMTELYERAALYTPVVMYYRE